MRRSGNSMVVSRSVMSLSGASLRSPFCAIGLELRATAFVTFCWTCKVGVSANARRVDRSRLKSSHADSVRNFCDARGAVPRKQAVAKLTAGAKIWSCETGQRCRRPCRTELEDVLSKKILSPRATRPALASGSCAPGDAALSPLARIFTIAAEPLQSGCRFFAKATNLLRLSIRRGSLDPPKTTVKGLQFGSTFK